MVELNKYDIEAGARLREIRSILKLSTYAIAEKLNIPQSTYSKLESGKMSIKVEVLVSLYKVFKVLPSYVCIGSGSKFAKAEDKKNLVTDISDIRVQQEVLKAQVDFLISKGFKK